jgi:DNA polymerase-3 subunit gamma/tau
MEKKKKSDFIIPPTYYRNNSFSIVEDGSQKMEVESKEDITSVTSESVKSEVSLKVEEPITDNQQPKTDDRKQTTENSEQTTPKVSALSLASIRARKEIEASLKDNIKVETHLLSESFTATEMLEQWLKYAQRMEDKGYRIIASLLTINDPTLDGSTILHELPNESSKIDFEKEKPELLGYLRGKLHNHDIQIVVKVNETLVSKRAFTNQDKYNRLVEINPNLEVLKKMFDLDV